MRYGDYEKPERQNYFSLTACHLVRYVAECRAFLFVLKWLSGLWAAIIYLIEKQQKKQPRKAAFFIIR